MKVRYFKILSKSFFAVFFAVILITSDCCSASENNDNDLFTKQVILKFYSKEFSLNFQDHPEFVSHRKRFFFKGIEFDPYIFGTAKKDIGTESTSESGADISGLNASGADISGLNASGTSLNSIQNEPGRIETLLTDQKKSYDLEDNKKSEQAVLQDRFWKSQGLIKIPILKLLGAHPDVKIQEVLELNEENIRVFLQSEIAVFSIKEDVTFSIGDNGKINFEGIGKDGYELNLEKTLILLKYALKNNISGFNLPLTRYKAEIHINSPELKNLGLNEIIAVGETDFSGSTRSRINNIRVGSQKLSGVLLRTGSSYSVAEHLGPVNGRTGYLPELVIKGPKTIPEYGGGLCQVSSTLYRGALNAGLKIIERQPHSYAVSYYKPWGTDATIYPPSVDLQFVNNTPGAVTMQAYMEGTKLRFIYYGTDDQRNVEMYGPFISNRAPVPPMKMEYTSELPPGKKKVVGGAHAGFKSVWYRYVTTQTGSTFITETIKSHYQARPLYVMIGAETEKTTTEILDFKSVKKF